MIKSVRFLRFSITLLTFLMISGCSKSNTQSNSLSESVKPVEAAVVEDDGVYVGSVKEISGFDGSNAQYAFMKNGLIYMTQDQYDEEGAWMFSTLIRVDPSGNAKAGDAVVMLESQGDESYIAEIEPTGDGYVYLEYIYDKDNTEIILVRCSEDGKIVAKRLVCDINQIPEGVPSRVDIVCDDENVYYLADGVVTVLDKEFGFKRKLLDANYYSGCVGPDGAMYFIDEVSGKISKYDCATDSLMEDIAMVEAGFKIYKGAQDELIVSTGSGVKSLNPMTGDVTILFDYTDVSLVNPIVKKIYRDEALGNIHIIFAKEEKSERATSAGTNEEFYTLRLFSDDIRRYDKDSAPKEDEIRIASFYSELEVSNVINEYMQAHPDVRVKVKTYMSSSRSSEDVLAEIDKDILNGVSYDIWITSGMDIRKYSSKGLFEDLMPYIENDASFDLSKYFENVLLCEREETGKVFSLASKAELWGLAADRSVFGDKETLTEDDIIDTRAQYQDVPFVGSVGNTQVLNSFLNSDFRTFIDVSGGKYNFDTAAFRKILEFSSTYSSATKDDFRKARAESSKDNRKVYFRTYTNPMSYLEDKAFFGDDFKMYKMSSPSGGAYYVSPYETYSICADSIHKEEAWELIKSFLDAYPQTWGFDIKVNREYFMEDWQSTYDVYKDGNEFNFADKSGYLTLTKEDYEIFIDMMESAEPFNDIGTVIRDIIWEEAERYFAGEKSVDEVIKIIQKRVNLYLEEKK